MLASAALAQGDQVSEETRELEKYISIFSRHTTRALRQDGKGKHDDELQELAVQVLENQRGLTPEQLVAAANALELDTQVP